MTTTVGRLRVGADVRAFWRHYRGYHRSVLLAGLVSGCAAVVELAMLAVIATIASNLGGADKIDRPQFLGRSFEVPVGSLLLLAGVLILVRCLLGLYEVYLEARLGSRYEEEKRAALLGAFLGATWPVQSSQRSNEVQDVATGAVMYGRVGAKAMASSLGSLCSTVIMLTGAFAMSWITTLGAIFLSVLLAASIQPLVRRSKAVGTRVRDSSLAYVTALGETVTMAREIRLAGVADRFFDRLAAISRQIRTQRTREQILLNAAPSLFETGAFLIVLAGLAVLHYSRLGDSTRFIAMLLLLLRASQYGRGLQSTYHQAKASLPYLEIIDERESVLRLAPIEGGTQSIEGFNAIELREVFYQYDSEGREALAGVDLRIEAGDVIGIIGPSGSGKSTLVELLLGLRLPTAGQYLIDGVPLRELDTASWHHLTGLVTQEPQLIEGDLMDNIRFLRPSVTDVDIHEAVAASGLGRDLESLADGLHTRIGTRSSGLSGGQRQRLSIARVLAGRPRLLVLDEPTSALDVHSEAVVTDTLQRLKGSTTIVVVAHRLSTLRVCDKVAVIRDGRVEAFADRIELERDNEYYSSAIDLAQIAQ
ncbi:MAG: ABC transporter ATP-binding protein [Aquihabitans sp.]